MHGPSWRYNDARNKLSATEARTLAALERGLVSADPRLARRIQRFGTRGRVARALASVVFVGVSATLVVGMALITPALALVLGTPVCVFVAVIVSRLYEGPRSRRRRPGPAARGRPADRPTR